MKVLKNEYFTINCSDSLCDISKAMLEISEYKVKYIHNFFKIDGFRCITVNLFDDLNEFKRFVANIRNVSVDDLPFYVEGTFDKGMINLYIDPNVTKNSRLYKPISHAIFHELVHIIYLECILKGDYSKRITWLDEGLAQNLSGEYDDDDLANILERLKSFKSIPCLNELKHGDKMVNNNYNGYVLAYLAVRYLIDTMDNNELLKIIESNKLSKEIGSEIKDKVIEYYLGKNKTR